MIYEAVIWGAELHFEIVVIVASSYILSSGQRWPGIPAM